MADEELDIIDRYPKDEEYEDEDRELKDKMTDFVNSYIVPTKVTRAFIDKIAFRINSTLIKIRREFKLKPCQIIFSYKGGNLMHLLDINAKKVLPYVVDSVLNLYAPYLRQSDNDFSVYIDPSIDDYEHVLAKTTIEVFYTLSALRRHFNANKRRYFPFFALTLAEKRKLLREHDTSLGEQYDMFITDEDDDILVYSIGTKRHVFYTSLNNALEFEHEEGFLSKFNLIRMKVAFMMQGKTIGGELIDISLPHRNDTNFQRIGSWDEFCKENFTRGRFGMKLMSLRYIIEDLANMLFTQTGDKPWLDHKYGKRIARLFYFSLLYMLNQKKVTEGRLTALAGMFRNPDTFKDAFMDEIWEQLDTVLEQPPSPELNDFKKVIRLNKLIINEAIKKMKASLKHFELSSKDLTSFDAFSS